MICDDYFNGSGANYDSGIIEYSCVNYNYGGAGKVNGGDELINIYF